MMDRMSRSNDRVSEEYSFNRTTEISQQAFTQGGQDVWRQGQQRNENTANNYLPQVEFFQQPQGAGSGTDSSAGNGGMLGGMPNPNQLMSSLMGGGGSDSSNSSPLSGLSNLFGGLTGGGGSPLGGDSSSSGSSSDSSGNTMKTVEEAASIAAIFA